MRCPYCGYNNPDQSHFCSGCGRKLEAKPVREQQTPPRQEMPPKRKPNKPGRSREEKKIITIGVILACAVLVAGIGAYFGVTHFLNKGETVESSRTENDKTEKAEKPKATATPEPSKTPTATPKPTVTVTTEPTPSAEPEELTVSLVERSSVNMAGYSRVSVKQTMASSTVKQEGYDNSANMVLDNNETTSWQEGVDGDGLGEYLNFQLSKEYEVKYLTFKLGNWRDQERYEKNNRPKQLTIWLDDVSFSVEFPDGKKEFCVELSADCPASEIYVRVDSVYNGQECDDTCISEIGIYGI